MSNPHVHLRKDGAYYFKFHGKTYVRAKRKDAEALYREKVENERFELATRDLRKVTVQMLLERWLITEINKVKRTTYDRKKEIAHNQVIPYLGKQQVATLSNTDIQNMLNKLYDAGYSHSVIKKAKDCIHEALKDMQILAKLPTDPFFDVTIPKGARKKNNDDIVFYNEKELQKIYEAAKQTRTVHGKTERIYRLGDFVIVLGNTGMRSGEMLALSWDDIDFKKKLININKTREEVDNTDPSISRKTIEIITEPKTKSSIRKIPMSKECEKALKNLYKITGTHQYVLSTKEGTPISTSYFRSTFKKIIIRAGMNAVEVDGKVVDKTYGLHSMRHSFATLMINKKGANISAVSKILGHSSTSITIDTYVHTDEKDKIDAIKLLNK